MIYDESYEEKYHHRCEKIQEDIDNGKFAMFPDKFNPETDCTVKDLINILSSIHPDTIIQCYQYYPGPIVLMAGKTKIANVYIGFL